MRAAADSHHPPVPENEFSQSSRFKRASKRLRRLAAIGAVWRDHLDAVSAQLLVQGIAVVGAVTDQILRLGFNSLPAADFWKPATTQPINIGLPIDTVRISQTIPDPSSQSEPSASACKDLNHPIQVM